VCGSKNKTIKIALALLAATTGCLMPKDHFKLSEKVTKSDVILVGDWFWLKIGRAHV